MSDPIPGSERRNSSVEIAVIVAEIRADLRHYIEKSDIKHQVIVDALSAHLQDDKENFKEVSDSIKFLTRGFYIAVGALSAIQFLLRFI